ncbi:putative internal virion protein B [Acinetobacter phage Aristophanes]|uniref:Putative internal virion protein B n=1 Tax=Acinetobacter phage Aristophanes TaxID=2759203 RepID=A0A7G9VYP8_BPACA|nr:putative internal virion protein B [Acinetobacter phage Aristophanes]
MATIVQQPELGQVQLSNLQAVMHTPQTDLNMSDFAMKLLGAGQKYLKDYDEENKARLVALGMTDYMNKTQREVGLLDRKYYGQGRDIQNITERRLERQQVFTAEVQRLANDPTTTPEQLDELGQEYQRANVDDIYAATALDTDYKEKLYEQVLKEDSVYMQVINKTIKKVNADRYTRTKLNVGGSLYNDILNLPMDAEDTTVYLGAKFTSLVEQAQKLNDLSLEDAVKDVQPVFAGTIQTLLGQLDETAPNTPEVLRKINTATQVMMSNGYIDLASPIIKDLREVTDRVYKYNGIQASLEQGQYHHTVEMGEQTYDIETVRGRVAKISSNPNLTPEDKAKLIKAEWDFAEAQNKAAMDGKFAKDPQYILGYGSAAEYVAANYGVEGVSEDLWYKTVIAAAEQQANYDPMVAGLNLLDFAQNKADRYDAKLYSEGGKRLASGFRTFATNSDAQAKASPQYKAAEQQFNTVGNLYRQWTSSDVNAARADAVLSGIEDDDLRYALQDVWQSGGTMSDLREKLQNPVQAQVRRQNFDKAWDKLDIKSADLKRTPFHNSAGKLLSKMETKSKEYQLNLAKEVIKEAQSRFNSRTVTDNPEALYQMARQDGLILRSKYSDIMLGRSTNDAFKQSRITTTKGVPLSRQLFAEVIDGKRELISAKLKISPENVLVELGVNGDAYFYAIKDGQVQNFSGIAGMEGTRYRNTEWKADMEKTYYARSAAGTKSKYGDMVVQSGAPLYTSKQRIKIHGKDGRVYYESHKIPVDLAVGFGGNIELARVVVNQWLEPEGFSLYKTYAKGIQGHSSGYVYGYGARTDKHTDAEGRALMKRFEAAQGNVDAMMVVQGDFNKYYFKKFNAPKYIREANLPVPTSRPLPQAAVVPLAALYDAIWHGGGGVRQGSNGKGGTGGAVMVQAYNAPSTTEGLRIFMNSHLYFKNAVVGTPAYKRNEFNLNAIKYYHELYKPTIRK